MLPFRSLSCVVRIVPVMADRIYDHSKVGRDLNKTAVQVLTTDLDAGLTFAKIAEQDGNDADKRHRNQANARKAYDSVVHYKERLETTAEQKQDLDVKLKLLKAALKRLGEKF